MASYISTVSEGLKPLPSGNPLNMVLIGKTGQGKSDTGNTILENEFFYANDDVSSVTRTNKSCHEKVGGRDLTVVDTPGCMDTEQGDKILDEIADAVTSHPEGYDAFLIVMKYPLRMTNEEIESINQLVKMFGEEIYRYAVVIFTHGDSFKAKQRKSKNPITFQQYVERDLRSGKANSLGPLFRNVGERVLLFNNMEEDENKRRQLVIDLVKQIDVIGGKRYDNAIFQKARELQETGKSEEERSRSLASYLKELFSGCSIM